MEEALITPRKLVLVTLLLCASAWANTVYIAQTAGTFSGGSACKGQSTQAYSYFNNPSNWTSGTPSGNQIGPGTTVYVCGTITGSGANGTNVLTFQGSGSSSATVHVIWDNGAIVGEPYCGELSNACVNLNGKSYLTLDGGTNGVIINYANGTSGANSCPGVTNSGNASCSYQQQATALEADCGTNCEIENFAELNSYVRTSTSDSAPAGFGNEGCIFINAISANDNVLIHDNRIHDGRWCVTIELRSGSNFQFYNNEIYNAGHAMAVEIDSNSTYDQLYIYNNHTHDFTAWSGNSAFHNNSLHVFQAGGNTTGTITHLMIYNNEFDGPIPGMTSHIYLEPNGNVNSVGTGWVFNNVGSFAGTESGGNGIYGMFAGGTSLLVANNTGICNSSNQSSSALIGMGTDQPIGATSVTNNLFVACSEPWYAKSSSDGGPGFMATEPNYNLYTVLGSGLQCNGNFYTTISPWASCIGNENHSAVQSVSPLPPCNSTTDCSNVRPQSGSAAISFGTNLNSTCNGAPIPGLGALCYDKPQTIGPGTGATVGNLRPTGSEAWDAGAYQSASGSAPPTAPTGLTAIVN